jgi:hypothetical protein
MSARESEPGSGAPSGTPPGASPAAREPRGAAADDDVRAERETLSYEGSRVPFFVVVIWVLFFVWGVYYLLRWIPESWREWFAR